MSAGVGRQWNEKAENTSFSISSTTRHLSRRTPTPPAPLTSFYNLRPSPATKPLEMPPISPLDSVDRFGDSNPNGTLMEKNNRKLDDCLRYCIVAGKKALQGADLGVIDLRRQGKSVAALKDEEDDDEILALYEWTTTYNLDASPDYVEEVFEVQIKSKRPTKRAADTKKKPLSTVTEISSNEDDEDYELEQPA